jgi:predicted metal-dependent peptidase
MHGAELATAAAAEMDRAIVALLLREPFFGHLLGGIVRRVDPAVPTAAVMLTPTGIQLVVNGRFFLEELDEQERVAVIKHEALHLAFRHLFRPANAHEDPKLCNLAADLVVNQMVDPWKLPDGAILLSTFPDLDLQPNRSLEWYLERLKRLAGQGGAGLGEGGGSGSGGPDGGDPPAPRSAEALRRLLSGWKGEHVGWANTGGTGFGGDGPELTEVLRKAMHNDLERALEGAAARVGERQWGRLPGRLRSSLERMSEARKPRIDWRRSLRLFASSSYRTRIVPTSRRMSKRFGQFPGIRIRREQRIAVVIDTSGSVPDVAIALFFQEIHGIWRTGAEVIVIEADADVQRTFPYRGKAPAAVEGRGGTDFDPAFRWLRERGRGKFDACIYLTDGEACTPKVRPPCPLLWVLTPDGMDGDHLAWGRSVRLPK